LNPTDQAYQMRAPQQTHGAPHHRGQSDDIHQMQPNFVM